MECIILGCGGSNGVPRIGCSCFVCKSHDTKNQRTRASIVLILDDCKILFDTSVDLRQQALNNGINDIDAVFYTHDHFDHVAGINDVKLLSKSPVSAFMSYDTNIALRRAYSYVFTQKSNLYKPLMRDFIFGGPFSIGRHKVTPFAQHHGKEKNSYGFRIGDFAYSTDVTNFSEENYKILEGVKVWVVDCLRYYYSPSHSYLEKTISWCMRIKPRRAILTHMDHDIDYGDIKNSLPPGIEPGYDGMKITIP